MGGVGRVACQGFLVREACICVSVFWWVELDLFSLECNEVSSVVLRCLWVKCDLAPCILMLRVMFLHCCRISLVCLALKLVGSWVEFGFSVGIEALG